METRARRSHLFSWLLLCDELAVTPPGWCRRSAKGSLRAEGLWRGKRGIVGLGIGSERVSSPSWLGSTWARVWGCDEVQMLGRLPHCGEAFAAMMHRVNTSKWCELSEFIVYYETFSNCTEEETLRVGCYWPNPLAQGFITGIHRKFFSNCTVDVATWDDPPDEVLVPLIVVPILLTVAMAGVVVWRSQRTSQLL
ncbi:receptor activity-modifying protein 3 [Ctenodactylus gundi]